MREDKSDRYPKRSRDPQLSERDRKTAVRRSSSRTRELRSKQTSRHEDERKRVASGRGAHGLHEKESGRDSIRNRQDGRLKRSPSPNMTSTRGGRRRVDNNGRSKRDVPEAKKERKEAEKQDLVRGTNSPQFAFGGNEVQQHDSAIANGGFGSIDFQSGFANSGFSNTNFADSGFRKNVGMDESNRAKPRILAPNNGGREGNKEIPAVDAPKFTVNELSAESIKRVILDGSNPTARTIQPTEKVERSKSETEQALVPRGRNYFIHDHRDTAFVNQRNQNNIRFGQQGRGRTAPTGWRNFGGREGNVDEASFAIQSYGRGGGGVGISARGGFSKGGFGNWRSKADEDLIWKHDKYVEVSQDEANTKLELVDEVGIEPQEEIFNKKRPQEGESRHRYQDESFDYEVEELAVYD
uniref:Btz domain-containing protein n=1 Tax=Meloidogyne javanica TaxID=6303 RepID=A0A915ND90_MELJA